MGRFFRWFGLPGNFVLTLLISLYGIILACVFRTPQRIICAAAMLLSSLGDILLMDYKPVTKKLPLRGFTAGAASFGIAHLVYASAFIFIMVKEGYGVVNPGFFCGIGLFVASVAALIFLMKTKKQNNPVMKVLPFCYLLLISFNLTVIFSCSVSRGAYGLISGIGALSFYVSDLILSVRLVSSIKIKHNEALVWWFYPIGQILLLTGA